MTMTMMMTDARENVADCSEMEICRDDDAYHQGVELARVVHEAWLAGPGPAQGGAKAIIGAGGQSGRSVTEFEVEIEGAMPGGSYQVLLDGVLVGQLSTDSHGNGRLELITVSEQGEESSHSIPPIGPNSVVSVGHILRGRLFATHSD